MTSTTTKNWKDISIRQYIDLYNLKEEDQYEALFKQIGILYHLNKEEVENIPVAQYQLMKSDMAFLMNEPDTTDVKKEFEIDGIRYQLRDFNSFTAGEWIDFESWNQDCINNIHTIMAVLYRKEGLTKYLPAEVDKAADIFLDNLDIETTLSAFFLFYIFALNFIPSDIEGCSVFQKVQMELKKMKKESKKFLKKEVSQTKSIKKMKK